MDRTTRRAFLVAGTAALAGCQFRFSDQDRTAEPQTTSTPDDNGGWPMPAFDPAATRYHPAGSLPAERPGTAWRATFDPEPNLPVLAAAGGAVGVTAKEGLTVVDADGGRRRWRRTFGDRVVGPGAIVTPETIVVPAGATVRGLAPTDGDERWRATLPTTVGWLVGTERGYVGATRHEYAAPNSGEEDAPAVVFALDDDGTERWRATPADVWPGNGAVGDARFGRVAVADGTAFVPHVGGDVPDALLALDATDGTRRWAVEAAGAAVPTVVDGTVYAGVSDGRHGLAAYSAADGAELWRTDHDAAGLYRTAALDDGVVAAHSGGVDAPTVVEAFTPNGDRRWRTELDANALPRALIAAGDALAVGHGTTVDVLSLDGGDRRWTVETGGDVGWLAAGGGALLAASFDGDVRAFA